MRVAFNGQVGGAPAAFRGYPYQRGSGLGSIFKGLLRFVLPFAKQAGQAIGREALSTGVNVARDVLEGENAISALEKHGRTGAKNLVEKGSAKLMAKLHKGGAIGSAPSRKVISGCLSKKAAPKKKKRASKKDFIGTYLK